SDPMPGTALELRDDFVRHLHDGSLTWELPLSSIRVIGEKTTPNGPFLDDYYFCFATSLDCWYEASFYCEGRKAFLQSLAEFLGPLQLRLVGSTDFDSNVLWPPELAGKPMFSFTPLPPTRWIARLIGAAKVTQSFAPQVLEALRARA